MTVREGKRNAADSIIRMGAGPVGNAPEAFGSYPRADMARRARVARNIGIKVD
jgi:hypothetical protein